MTITSDSWAARPTRRSPISSMSTWFDAAGQALAHLRERRRARANYRALGAVSNATLKDIGVHRSEVMSLSLGDASGRRRSMGCR